METMRAVIAHDTRNFKVETVPKPTAGPGEVLLKIEAAGICASDRVLFEGNAPFGKASGQTPGHEYVGLVEELGEGAAERYGLALGDRCMAEVQIPCGECISCLSGHQNLCYSRTGFLGGSWAEYMLLRKNAVIHKVPKSLDKLVAATIEPLSCGAYAASLGNITMSDTVVVSGMGAIGLAALQFAKLHTPYRLIALSATDASLDIARGYGVKDVVNVRTEDAPERVRELTDGLGCDVFIECSGVGAAAATGISSLRRRGRLVLYGVYTKATEINLNDISQGKELSVVGGKLSPGTIPYVIKCLEEGLVDPRPMITEVFGFDRFDEAIHIRETNPDSVKTLLVP